MALHDFNNDSRLDVVVANSGTDNIGILLGNNNGTFGSQMIYATGTDSQPSSVAVGDFNNDGQVDIVVANFGAHTIGIFLGNGDGTFANQTTFSTGSSRPLRVAVGDFDNDSRLDIVYVSSGTNNITVLLGYNNGKFSIQKMFFIAYDSLASTVVVGDFNKDSNVDIAVANSGTHNLAILLGDGNGTFSFQTAYSTGIGSQPTAIAIADLNNDTILDIVVANYGTNNVCVFFGDKNGTFVMKGTYTTGTNSKPMSVVIGDFDNNNRFDIVVSNRGTRTVGIFLGYMNGTFANQKTFSTGISSQPYFVASGDFNSDGRLDIAVADYSSNSVDILLGYANITLSGQTTYSTDSNSQLSSVAVGDINNDKILDIVVTDYGNGNIGVFIGNGDGTFSNQKTYYTGDGYYPYAVALGDFNNDSLLDIVITYITDDGGVIGTLLTSSNGTFSNLMTTNTLSSYEPVSIAVGDFNNDSRLDIVVVSGTKDGFGCYGSIEVLFGNGNGTFSNEMSFLSYDYNCPQFAAVGNFNNDGLLDIVVANRLVPNTLSSNVGIFLGDGNGTFSDLMSFSTGYYSLTQCVAVGDFNNDSRLDLVVSNS
jgi:hypothetical protein